MIRKTIHEASAGDIVRKAIAVLPVSNLTGNPNLEYIAAGFQDDLIGKLGAISGLTVRPTSSTLQFKDSKETPQQMAKKLTVSNMVESTIKGTEEYLQIEVRLIEAFPEEKYIWNHSYKLSWDSIGNIYNEILNRIIDIVKVKPTSQDVKNLSNVQKHNADLLKACFQGRYYVNRLTREDFERGLKYYNEAIAIDPTDPLPYLGLALAYSNAGHVSNVADDAYYRAIGYARQAIEIDSTTSEAADAYVVLASKLLYTDWDFSKAEHYLKQALKLNPNNSMAHYHYGWFLMLSNNVDGTVAEFNRSIEIDPTNAFFTANLAGYYYWTGRPEEALSEAEKALQLDPNNVMAFVSLGNAYTELGMYDKAINAHKKGISISPDFEGDLGVTYARMGQREKAVEIATRLEKTQNSWYSWQIAAIYATLGDNDKAIDWIELAYKNRHDFTPWFKYYIYYKPLYNDSRFQEIIQRLNLPD